MLKRYIFLYKLDTKGDYLRHMGKCG